MKNLPLLFLLFVMFSCVNNDEEQSEYARQVIIPEENGGAIDASGVHYPFLDPGVIYCNHGWGRKFCRFLSKHDGTIWADAENYYSDFSDIKLSKFTGNEYFISFYNLDTISSYCEGWKVGETTYNGTKWNIDIKKDKEDVFWFDYDYYGSGEEIEYSITYKYEVIDGLLHFSSTEGQTFIFNPSEKNYSEDFIETDEIIKLEGCQF